MLELTLGEETGAGIANRLPPAGAPEVGANFIGNLILGCAAGTTRGKLSVGISDSVGVRASGTITCVVASMTAGDTLLLDDVIFTCVAGTATAASGQYSKDTSNTACGISLAAAINAVPASKARWIATESTGTVTVTERTYGTGGNLTRLRKKVTTAAAHVLSGATFTLGVDPSARVTSTVTCVFANTDNDDTLTIGGVVFTGKTSGATGEDQFNLGTTNTTMGDNLLAKIIAHAKFKNIVTGVNTAGAVVLTWNCNPRLAILAGYMATSDEDGLVLTAQPATTLTLTGVQTPITYALGAA